MKRAIAAMFLLASTFLAEASAWHVIAISDRESLEVDNATYKIAGNVVTVWVKHSFKAPQILGGTAYDSTLSRMSIDCVNDTVVTPAFQYRSGDTTILSTSYPMADIPPDSFAQAVEKAVCPRQ